MSVICGATDYCDTRILGIRILRNRFCFTE